MKRIAIVAGGTLSKQFLSDIAKSTYIIGVDRGAYWLIVNGIIPDIAIGDFDSVSARELQVIRKNIRRVEEHPKEKDLTDMELAVVHAIKLRPKEIVIYRALGSRLDHTLANIHLLEKIHDSGVIRDGNNEVRFASGRLVIRKESRYRYVSLLPVSKTIEVTLRGFLYDASHALIRRGQTLGISNEICGDKATIEVHRGRALVIRSRD